MVISLQKICNFSKFSALIYIKAVRSTENVQSTTNMVIDHISIQGNKMVT